MTYVTNSELGFDYLRDNLAQSTGELVQRDFNFCIIDEVDSILIGDGETPWLIISPHGGQTGTRYIQAAKIADAFEKDYHYKVDEKQKSVLLSEEGYEAAEDLLQVTDLYDPSRAAVVSTSSTPSRRRNFKARRQLHRSRSRDHHRR